MNQLLFLISLFFLLCPSVYAGSHSSYQYDDKVDINSRTFGTNFKDFAFLKCLQIANKELNVHNKDLDWSVHVFFPEWIAWDADDIEKTEKTMREIDSLSEKYIRNVGGLKHDPQATLYTFGCLNFYHSDDLDKLMRSFVYHPDKAAREYDVDMDL